MDEDVTLALQALKSEFPRLHKWDNSKLITFLAKNWSNANSIQENRNKRTLWLQRKSELEARERDNPSNEIKVEMNENNSEEIKSLQDDNSKMLDWTKTLKIARHKEAPLILLDNTDEVSPSDANTCPISVDVRVTPSNHYSVLTAYYDKTTGKWHESRRASHPFLSVRVTKIDPNKWNKLEKYSANLQLMADSGTMCSLLNYEAVKAMGIDPNMLVKSHVTISGINRKNCKPKNARCASR